MSPPPASHNDTQAVHSSLVSNGASFSLYPFTPRQIHIWTSPKPTVETTGQGSLVMDKKLRNDGMAWNQALSMLQSLQEMRWAGWYHGKCWEFWKPYMIYDECWACWSVEFHKKPPISQLDLGVSNNYKSWAQQWNDAQNCCWSN